MKALILGHYGGRNFGDELMLVGLVRLLRRRGPSVAIRIQTPDSSVSKGLRQLGVEGGYGKSPVAILKGLLWADTVVLGGGTIFHDAYPDERYRGYWRNLLLLSLIFALARMLGRHVSLAGIGVGPLRRRRTKAFTALLKWSAHDISVRDQQSADDLAMLPGGQDKVRLADDLSAFASISPAGAVGQAGKVIGLSLVPPEVVSGAEPADVEAFYGVLGDHLAAALASGLIGKVMLFSANVGKDSDLPVAARMTERLASHAGRVEHVRFDGDPVTFVQRLAECAQVLAARYHVAIAASTLDVPTLWLAYQRKVMDAAPAYGAGQADIFDLADLCRSDDRRYALFSRIGEAKTGGATGTREGARIDPTSALLGAS